MTCPRCRTDNAAGTAFCTSCGVALRGDAPVPRAPSTGLATASLVIGILSLLTCSGLLLGAFLGTTLGIVALVRAKESPATHGGRGLAIGGIVTSAVSVLGAVVLAAIAIPSLLHAKASANEAAAIGDIRTVIAAEAAYQASNGGQYDTLECLAAPAQCIPDYAPNQPTFIDRELTRSLKANYRRRFQAGPASDPSGRGTLYSPSSLTAYAYAAEPMEPGRSGVRAFCGDHTGLVCQSANGRISTITDGRCPSDCVAFP